MKAQGLSVSFVVVAALAILVLVLGVAFLMGAFSSQRTTTSMQQAKSTCNSMCGQIQAIASSHDCTTGNLTGEACIANVTGSAYTRYCNAKFNIGGDTYSCTQLTSCVVSDSYNNPITIECLNSSSSSVQITGNNT